MIDTEIPALDELAQFHEERKAGLGSTDSAAILGVSPWKSAHDVWRDKVADNPPREPSLPMWLGLKLQEAVAELYSTNTGHEVEEDPRLYTVGEGIVRAHVDYRWDDETPTGAFNRGALRVTKRDPLPSAPIVELKTARSKRGWGPYGTDDVPRHYWIQVQHQMACLPEVPFAEIAVLFGHQDFRVYHIPRSQPFIDSLIQDMQDWWSAYVVTGTPPPVDGTAGAAAWLKDRYPTDSIPAVPATPEQGKLVQELQMLRETGTALLRAEELVVQKLKESIGEYSGMYGSGWSITWKQNKERLKIDWQSVAHDLMTDPVEAQKVVDRYTQRIVGARPFILELLDADNG